MNSLFPVPPTAQALHWAEWAHGQRYRILASSSSPPQQSNEWRTTRTDADGRGRTQANGCQGGRRTDTHSLARSLRSWVLLGAGEIRPLPSSRAQSPASPNSSPNSHLDRGRERMNAGFLSDFSVDFTPPSPLTHSSSSPSLPPFLSSDVAPTSLDLGCRRRPGRRHRHHSCRRPHPSDKWHIPPLHFSALTRWDWECRVDVVFRQQNAYVSYL